MFWLCKVVLHQCVMRWHRREPFRDRIRAKCKCYTHTHTHSPLRNVMHYWRKKEERNLKWRKKKTHKQKLFVIDVQGFGKRLANSWSGNEPDRIPRFSYMTNTSNSASQSNIVAYNKIVWNIYEMIVNANTVCTTVISIRFYLVHY